MLHFIWVCTVCHSTCLGVSGIQGLNKKAMLFSIEEFVCLFFVKNEKIKLNIQNGGISGSIVTNSSIISNMCNFHAFHAILIFILLSACFV